jgi:hypothetical protein
MLDKENRDPLLFNFADAQTACATEGSHLWRLFDGEEEWTAVLSHVQKNLTPSSPCWWLRVAKVGKCPGSKGRCEEEALRGKGALVEWTRGNYGPYFSRAVQSLNWQEDCLYVDPGSNFLWKASNCKNDPRQALCVKRECRAEN